MSPIFQSRNVTFWKGGGICTFGKGRSEALAPRMIRTGNGRHSLFVKCLVEMFGRDDLRLSGLLGVDGKGQRFAIIQDGDFFLGVEADGDEGIAQSIGRALGLDLVDSLVELEGEGAMGIDIASGLLGKASIEVFQKFR